MISSAVMTCSFSLPGRLSVSSPFEVLRRAIGRQTGGTLYLAGSRTPLVMREKGRSPMASAAVFHSSVVVEEVVDESIAGKTESIAVIAHDPDGTKPDRSPPV